MLGNCALFLSKAVFFFLQNYLFFQKSFRSFIRVSNRSGSKCLQRISAEDTSRWMVNWPMNSVDEIIELWKIDLECNNWRISTFFKWNHFSEYHDLNNWTLIMLSHMWSASVSVWLSSSFPNVCQDMQLSSIAIFLKSRLNPYSLMTWPK